MALPKLKEKTYKHFLQGLQKEVTYRGFTTKEQEILLECKPIQTGDTKIPLTSEQEKEITDAICQVVTNCIIDNISAYDLTYFDLIDIFIRIRKVSVSELVELKYQLTHKDEEDERYRYEIVEHIVNLDDVKVIMPAKEEMNIIIDNDEGLEYICTMRYPTIREMLEEESKKQTTDIIPTKAYNMLAFVMADGEVYTKDDISFDDWKESFSTFGPLNQQKFIRFMTDIPDIEYDFDIISKRNPNLIHHIRLKGLSDFF